MIRPSIRSLAVAIWFGVTWVDAGEATQTSPGYGHLTPMQVGILANKSQPTTLPAFSFDLPAGPSLTEAQRQAQLDAGKTVLPLVAKAFAAGAASAVIPPGDYRFGKETWGPAGPIYPLEFANLRRDAEHPFTIDASGATLWFDLGEDQTAACHFCVAFKDCSNVVFRGATIDRGSRGNIEGCITQFDAPNRRIEIALSPGVTVPGTFNGDMNQRLLPFKADGRFCAPLYALQSGGVHLKYRGITPGSMAGRSWVTMDDTALLDTIRDPDWLAAYGDLGILRVGDGLSCIYTTAVAISLTRSANLTMQGLRVHAAKSMGEELGGFGAHLWKECYFGPRPGTSQWQGGDGFMFNATRHGTTFDNVTIIHSTDDPANIHGYWSEVAAVDGSRITFGAAANHDNVPAGSGDGNARGLPVAVVADDRVRFFDRDSARELGTATVMAIADKRTVILDHPVTVQPGTIVEWPDHQCAGWTIQNCTWQDNYQRLMIQSGPGMVRNCTFTRLGSLVELNSVFCGIEGGVAHDITITDNVFSDVAPQPHGTTIGIYFRPYQHPQARIIRGLTITGNTIIRPGSQAITLEDVDGAVIAHNRIVDAVRQSVLARPKDQHLRQAIQLRNCAKVEVRGNLLSDPGRYTVADPRTGSGILGVDAASGGVTLDGTALR
jgi:hypothetical protein